jgi:hypothetical protein
MYFLHVCQASQSVGCMGRGEDSLFAWRQPRPFGGSIVEFLGINILPPLEVEGGKGVRRNALAGGNSYVYYG